MGIGTTSRSCFHKTEDDNGKPLPQNKVINEEISATLITWDMIKLLCTTLKEKVMISI